MHYSRARSLKPDGRDHNLSTKQPAVVPSALARGSQRPNFKFHIFAPPNAAPCTAPPGADALPPVLAATEPFRHTTLPQTTTTWLVAQATTWQMIGRCLCPFRWHPLPISLLVLVRSFIEPVLFDNNLPFDNTTPIYLINQRWKLWLVLALDLKFHYFSIFRRE